MGNWKIAVVRGIPIRIHWTFLLLPAFFAVSAGSITGAIRGVILILLLFVCVALHELGHSVAAQHYGIEVKEISLLPIGGLAKLSAFPKKPSRELVVALAGPAVNLVLVILFIVLQLITDQGINLIRTIALQDVAIAGFDLLSDLASMNVFLALFNLIPAFPMDGGRVLRAALGYVLSFEDATLVAMWVGRIFAGGFVLIGVFTSNFLLALVGVFVFGGAGAEYQMVRQNALLRRLQVRDVLRPAALLHPLDLLGHVAPIVFNSTQPLYPVTDGVKLEGAVTPEALIEALQRFGPATKVEQIVHPGLLIVPLDESLLKLYEEMVEQGQMTAVAVDDRKPVGLVVYDDIVNALKGYAGI